MAPQSSRLNRLLTLLDTGSTQATRFAAAQQIGDIAKSHPQDLNSLWDKVSLYLRSKNWDTRAAAARAIGAIAANIKHTSLIELSESLETELVQAGLSDACKDIRESWSDVHPSTTGGLSFDSFDVSKVLDFGSPLLASGGQEYDVAYDSSKSPEERLAFQKQSLHRRLGLDICEHFMDVSEMIRDEDLLAPKVESNANGPNDVNYAMRSGRNVQQFVANMVPNYYPKRLSARELNLLKRKAKVNAKDHMKGRVEDDKPVPQQPQMQMSSKATCSDSVGNKKVDDSVDDGEIVEHEGSWRWPFSHFVEQLLHDIFDPVWEVRHGTLMALREIMTHQGSCAGVLFPDPNSEQFWLVETDEIFQSTKRRRDIDLNNVQFEVDTQEPALKRQKMFEEPVYPLSNLQTDIQYSVDMVTNGFSITKMNGDSYNTAATISDNIGSHIKVEPVHTNGFGSGCKAGDVSTLNFFVEDKNMISNIKFTTELENPKIARMIKLAKHSWIKNWEILQDSAIRLICILSLDRFGDYVSDQVVAPVRETCAQALGAVIKYMHPPLVYATLNVLLQMQHSQEWEIRHGCLLGIKYLVAVRPEMIEKLLIYVLPACKAGLEDPDDDVRAVAAEALIPAASFIVTLDDSVLHSIVKLLWDILLDLDDLSPSTSSVMNLLSEIYSQPSMVPKMLEKLKLAEKQGFDLNKELQADEHGYEINDLDSPYILSTITPRLWPFMRHTITCVRHSSIRTLERLLEVGYKSSMDSTASRFWPASVLGDALRIVFQNLLLESNDEIIQSSVRVWRLLLQCPVLDLEGAASSYFSSWMQLASTSYGSPLDSTKMFWPVALPRKSRSRAAAKMRAVKHENEYDRLCTHHASGNSVQEKYIDASIATTQKIIVGVDSERSVTHTRVVSAEALGVFASKLPESSLQILIDPLWNGLISLSGVQRQVASTITVSWFRELRSKELHGNHGDLLSLLSNIRQWLFELLTCSDPAFPTKNSHLPYIELSKTYAKMRNEAKLLLQSVESSGLFQINSSTSLNLDTLSIHDAMNFASNCLLSKDGASIGENESNAVDFVEGLRNRLLATSGYLKCVQNNLHVTVSASVAAAVVWMSDLPAKLNPVILPLMAAIKREEEEILQHRAAEALAELIFNCIGRKPSPNDKLIRNLCNLTWSDSSVTPQAAIITSMDAIEDQNLLFIGNSTNNRRAKVKIQSSDDDRSKMDGFISRRGSELALQHLCEKFGSALFEKLPKLWDCLTEILKPEPENLIDEQTLIRIADSFKDRDPQALINNIQVVGSISPIVDKTLQPQLLSLLPCMLSCLRHCHVAVRLAASRSITSMAKSMTDLVMGTIIEIVIKLLADSSSVQARQGAGMLVTLLVQNLGATLVPYAPLLVIPLLKCMGDNDPAVRQSVTHSFAALVPLLPLSRGLPPPTGLSESLSKNTDDAQFLEQLLDNSNIDDYVLPVDLNVKLRRYQQEGINWLSFLRRFKLHGILCDDMGLGKTLQASAIVAADIVEGRACNNGKDSLSLIVCPSTLVGHWAYEIEKFIDKSVITTLQYVGSAQERTSLQGQIEKCNVLITSYDVIRKDIDYLGNIAWNYCILDEGHIIKNPKSKITCAVKQLKAERRLILSGTPIQNNVLELWSLFDFLMPGFLGMERQFHATYGKPLVAAKDSKCSAKDAEAGVLAMEALHKQVMPFLLRRTKDEVLNDLPAKIIQDRYCDLSPLQLRLYEQFSSSDAKKEISTLVIEHDTTNKSAENASTKATSHIFQAMQYLLKLCSHPLLVIGSNPPDSLKNIISDVIPGCSDIIAELHALHHSPKLVALHEILMECGIGSDASSCDSPISAGQHRVLIFAQHRSLLDVIEKDLFQAHMKSVSYLRLDGGVEQSKRFEIVKTFNSDPTIDVLLLTTNVGGLGLNLTSADTLVFMEHDWNPMKDLQAMDRAHRLGQRKVVNVHRLIMRGTLEEKVMSYQKFKVSVANAVITAENASLKTMNTDQLLDLFSPAPNTKTGLSKGLNNNPDEDSSIGVKGKGANILKGLGELWDQSQYDEEYNLSKFLANFNG